MNVWHKYLSKLDEQKKIAVVGVLERCQQIISQAQPFIVYGIPALRIGSKNIVGVAAHKNHLGIYPFSPLVVKTLVKVFPILETSEGTIRFKYDQLPSQELLEKMIELRTREIQTISNVSNNA